MTNPKTAFDNFSVEQDEKIVSGLVQAKMDTLSARPMGFVAKPLEWLSFVDEPGVWTADFIDCRYHVIAQNTAWEVHREVFLDADFNLIGSFSNLEQAKKCCQDDTVSRLAALTDRIREFCV